MSSTLKNINKGKKLAAWITFITFLLALLKAVVGVLANSVILIADAIHSVVDILAIFASWVGLKIASRKKTEKFPYGYYKAENIASLVISIIIFYAGYEVFIESYHKLFELSNIKLVGLALAVPIISAIASYVIAKYEERIGKEINSHSLIANAQESKMDVWASLVVLIGVALSYLKIKYVEGIFGIIISLMIFKISIETAYKSVLALMDALGDKDLAEKIKSFISRMKEVDKVKDIKIRQSGPVYLVESVIALKRNVDIKTANIIAEHIEREVKKRFESIDDIKVYIKHSKKDKIKVYIPIERNDGLISAVLSLFGRSKFYFEGIIKNNQLVQWKILKNPFYKRKIRAGLAATRKAIEDGIDVVITHKIGEISYNALKSNHIEIVKANKKTVK